MAPNKNRHSKSNFRATKNVARQNFPPSHVPKQAQMSLNDEVTATGNEEYTENIFTDIKNTSVQNNIAVVTMNPQEPALVATEQAQAIKSNAVSESNTETKIDTVIDIEPTDNVLISSDTVNTESSSHDLNEDPSLSARITRLSTPNGAEVYLIGTAHFSQESVQDVRKLIKSVQPTSVILELCRERAFMLTLDEESLLEQNRELTFEKARNAIAEKGIAQGLIYIMFIKMSASLTEKLGLAPGAEFRAGSDEARKISGCTVVLGDRSLKVTIARAVASVSLWQKIKLIYQVLLNDVSITQEDIEKCKDKDMLEQLLNELGGEFPGFKSTILDERNVYLAHSIYQWAQNSETSMGPPRVVAIVGIGHVAGIVENWGTTTGDQIEELNLIPKPSKTRRVVTTTIKYCTVAALIYFSFRLIVPSSIQNSINEKIVEGIRKRY